ncbi:transposase [Prevotella nigrescens]
MSKIYKHYSEEEKLSLIGSYYQSGQSQYKFCKDQGLCNTSLLNHWLKRYESSQEMVSLCSEPESVEEMANRSKDSYKEEVSQLKKRIKDLEKALDYSKLETLARDIMIDKAEEYFDISIRKKSGAKQR